MSFKARTKKKPTKAIAKLKEIRSQMSGEGGIRVGLPAGSNDYPDGTSVIMVGNVHEFGSPKMNVPERSFLRSTLHERRSVYKSDIRKLGKRIATGTMSADKALELLGLKATTDVKDKLTDLSEPALKPATIASKKSSNPLIDTGHLRQSITWEKF